MRRWPSPPRLIDRSGIAQPGRGRAGQADGAPPGAAGAGRAHRAAVPGPGRPAAAPDRGHQGAVLPDLRCLPRPARRHRRDLRPPRLPGRLPPGPLLLPRHLVDSRPLATAQEPPPDPRPARSSVQEDDPRAGQRGPRPARGTDQLARRGQRLGPGRHRAGRLRRVRRPGRHRGPLFSRGPSKRSGLAASDPDGGWYVREGDHREPEDHKGKTLRKIAWALEATMARPPGAGPGCPNLAAGLALARPGQDPGGTGARVLASIAARGHKTGWLGFDRAYTAALPARFHLPARALGYSPVMDYRADQLGIQASTSGAILVEGTWYCPALPEPLITATASLRGHAIDQHAYQAKITARAPYQLKHKDGPDTDGYQRLSCPATGVHPRLICPLRENSLTPATASTQDLQPPRRPAESLPSDRDHHRARHRRPLPPGPALRHARLARALRHLAQHHRRPQRLRQRPRPRSTRPARPPPRPRHRRPVHLHRTAAHGRQHPQDPRQPGTSRRATVRQHQPAGHADAGPACPTTSQTADRHTAPSITTSQQQPARPALPGHPATTPRVHAHHPTRPGHTPGMHCHTPKPYSNGHHNSSVGTTLAVLSVTPGSGGRI